MKNKTIVLVFFLSIFPVTVSADLVKWFTTSGVNIIEDTETGFIWQDSFSEYHTFSEAQIACHSSNFGGVLGWDIPTYETMRQFLSAYQRYNPSQSKFYPNTTVYDLHHWTTTKIYTTYRRLGRLKYDGMLDESSYVDPNSSGSRIGGKCYTLLPNNSPNGIATPPEFLKSSTSKQSLLPNEQLYLKSYWVDKDDSLELVRVRYRNVYSQDWVQVQATYIEGHPQFEAHYAAQISVQKPGFYEVAYQAVSKDGSYLATSEWVNGGDTFTVEKVGVTSPDFLEAYSEDVSDVGDNHKRFTATWSDTDGDPFIFFGKFRYRAKGSSVWSETYSMTDSGSFGDTKTFTAEHSFDDEGEGVYEIQFQASSASDFNGFDAVESAWSPSAPITFELLGSSGASDQENDAGNIMNVLTVLMTLM